MHRFVFDRGNNNREMGMLEFKRVIGILLLALITGCATPMQPALTNATEKLDLGDDCLVLLTAELANDYKPTYQPEAIVLNVETQDPKDSKDRLNFLTDKEGTFVSQSMNKYIFRARLKPGKYVLRGIMGSSGLFPVRGMFFAPLHCEIEAKKGEVMNLGKVVARTRERQGNEFRSGPVIPLIDQAVTGFSGSTFEVQTLPGQEEDLARMKLLFPALRTAQIVDEPLPPFNREAAQKWWEAH